ncbi:MAG: zf-HC2 domain-containing protein [Candidatus Aminicenantes bacterium]|nr:zf-HC2 domain-containing protein [Candidatus Aminicenantes bacterium]
MACKKYKKDIPLLLYGELDAEQKALLEEHIAVCPDCRRDLEETRKAFQCIEPTKHITLPEANWDKSWRAIQSSVGKEEKRPFLSSLGLKSALAAAGILLVFAAGVFIGRLGHHAQESPTQIQAVGSAHLKQLLSSHFEDLKPVLIEYSNYDPGERSDRILIDREVIKNLLIQNLLLKRLLKGETADPVYGLLEDVDIILKDISNLNKGDENTPSLIRKAIKQQDILFKMEVLNKI